MDLFRIFISFLYHGCVKSVGTIYAFFLRVPWVAVLIFSVLTREFTYICILHKSPPQKRKKIGFLLSWLDLDEEEILVKGLVHWIKWPETLSGPSMLQSIFPKSKPWLFIETSDLWSILENCWTCTLN